MKSKILSLISLSILSLVLMVSCVSAVERNPLDIIGNDSVINHGDSFDVSFKIDNQESQVLTNVSINLPLFAFGSWTGAKYGGVSYIIDSDIVEFNDIFILDGTTSNIFTLTFKSDAYESGTDVGTISLDGKNNETGYHLDINNFDISIDINEDKSLSITDGDDLTKTQNGTVNITNNGNVILEDIDLKIVSSADLDLSFDTTPFTLNPGASVEVEIYSINIDNLDFGDDNTFTIKANNSETESNTLDYEVPLLFCEDCSNSGNLEINDININVKQGFGDDEEYWYPFDVIEVEVEIENDGSWDIQDIELSWALYTTAGKKITDDTESDFNLDENDEKLITFTFALDEDVDDMESEDLILYIKAQGEIDDNDAEELDNQETCVETSEKVSLITNDDFVVLDDIEINGMSLKDLELVDAVACGTELQIIADVWNIGDHEQDDVTVLITNSELGISELVEIGNIDSFDKEKLETTITIPENAEAKYYTLEFRIYDEDNEIFETDEEEKAIFKVLINVDGNCKLKESAKITADLTSEAKAGEQLTVQTTITNTEDKTVTYVINVKDYSEWATLEDLESNTITLVAGESRDITLTFNVNKGVSGNKIFNIEVISDTEVVTTQPVSVSIEPQNVFGFLPGNNLYLWGIGALNILLILSIIVVAIRLSKE